MGLLSDALESFVNLIAAVVALFALSVAARPALGKAGATRAFLRRVAPRAAASSAPIGPRKVESIFL